MENEVFETLTHYLVEKRLVKMVGQDEEYQAAKLHECEVKNKFESSLTPEQREMFNSYIAAVSETTANIERLHYQQGMKDLFALFKALY